MEKKPWIVCAEFLKAIEEKNFKTVNRILDTGFDIDTELKVQRTAISICASNGWYEIAHLLMTRGCSLSLKTGKGETPLHLAVQRSDFNLVELLLENRADVTSVDHLKKTVLHHACQMGCLRITTLLAEYSNSNIINMKDGRSKTPLMYACHKGCLPMITCLLSKGAKVNTSDLKGNSPLIHAISNQQCSPEMIRVLLDAGADIHHTNSGNETALLYACRIFSQNSMYNSNVRDILLLLIESGSDVKAKNRLCETALHLAVGFQDEILIRKLLNYGADVNATTSINMVPLVCACKRGPHEIISLLIDAGARFNFGFQQKYIWTRWPLPADEFNNPCGKFVSLILNLMDKFNEGPPPLKNLCRNTIRKSLPKSIENSALCLPLPMSLIRYILFSD
ncbi:ankyrin-2 [Caerostris extrusa]|uniref:Ankyrin-2 n=1 Tax=Caerostris extrusa TaxID=172846 RepID=A0AAV4TXE4_CAEEX|nr:ankyrin-2 [Caerostris extrusa]